jgi:regulator of nucleoside diphosphate kinase
MNKNRVSVFAPIGIALLGYQEGSQIQWEMPDGLLQFRVLKVKRSVVPA